MLQAFKNSKRAKTILYRSLSVNSNELRSKFLNFFEKNGHTVVPGSSLIPKNDESLLFVNAGMVQFKQVFLGTETRPYKRATTSQLCIRAGGKHNDLENVGFTPRHQTLFEMLGNFSLGDYFKEEAIFYAWTFLTQELNLSPQHLRVSVYKEDEEARKLWKKIAHLDDQSIFSRGKKDNFWSMSNTVGPCGPCTEIFYTPDIHCYNYDQFLEIWNCVFMQYNQNQGELIPLTNKYVDTGMGAERMLSVLQNVPSNFDTDVFTSIKSTIYSILEPHLDLHHIPSLPFPSSIESSYPSAYIPLLNILSDHLRTISLLIYQGIYPSATKQGYILRKLIRRSLKYGYMYNLHEAFLSQCIPCVLQELSIYYPEILSAQDNIIRIVSNEEYYYLRALSTGREELEALIQSSKKKKKSDPISFHVLQDLYSSVGIPVDLSTYILQQKNVPIDIQSIEKGLKEEPELPEKKKRNKHNPNIDDYVYNELNSFSTPLSNTFNGYTIHYSEPQTPVSYQLKAIFVPPSSNTLQTKSKVPYSYLCIDPCPFYACSGGQSSDTGSIILNGHSIPIIDTVKLNENCILLKTSMSLEQFKSNVNEQNNQIQCSVDLEKRKQTSVHHTSTHLLHSYLRSYLYAYGTGNLELNSDSLSLDLPPIQAGSSVDSQGLRFDFINQYNISSSKLNELLSLIERDINKQTQKSTLIESKFMSYTESLQEGFTGLFVDNYKESVRGVTIPQLSKELCGGTHAERLSDLYPFLILRNSSISAGIKRIEAVAGKRAIDYLYQQYITLRKISSETGIGLKEIQKTLLNQKEELRSLSTEQKQLYKYIYEGYKPSYTRQFHGENLNVFVVPLSFSSSFLESFPSYLSSNHKYIGINIFVRDKTIICQKNTSSDIINCKVLLNSIFSRLKEGGHGGGKPSLAQGQAKENVNDQILQVIESLE